MHAGCSAVCAGSTLWAAPPCAVQSAVHVLRCMDQWLCGLQLKALLHQQLRVALRVGVLVPLCVPAHLCAACIHTLCSAPH